MATEPITTAAATHAASSLSTGALGTIMLLFGPGQLADHALVALGALAGCLHSLGSAPTGGSKTLAAWYVLRWVVTALILAGAVAWAAESVGVPASRWPAAVGLFITLFANEWGPWLRTLGSAGVNRIAGAGRPPDHSAAAPPAPPGSGPSSDRNPSPRPRASHPQGPSR